MLLHLDCHKSVGPDRIHLRVLRELAKVVAKLLSIVYYYYFPSSCKRNSITQHKKSNRGGRKSACLNKDLLVKLRDKKKNYRW